jgi:membrane protease YdiL (CAAX protease family)
MPYFLPLILMFVWFGGTMIFVRLFQILLPDLDEVNKAIVDHSVLSIFGVCVVVLMIFHARMHFERGIKGFGLNLRTILRDFEAALLNLLAVWPIIIAAMIVTVFICKLIVRPDFELPPHMELELLISHRNIYLRILVFFVAAVLAPILEELLFRGYFQTMLRSILAEIGIFQKIHLMALKPWAAIILTSGLFAIVHFNRTHWPALFLLSMCLGYSYEKSGSLFRPIFIHMIFNTANLINALYLSSV